MQLLCFSYCTCLHAYILALDHLQNLCIFSVLKSVSWWRQHRRTITQTCIAEKPKWHGYQKTENSNKTFPWSLALRPQYGIKTDPHAIWKTNIFLKNMLSTCTQHFSYTWPLCKIWHKLWIMHWAMFHISTGQAIKILQKCTTSQFPMFKVPNIMPGGGVPNLTSYADRHTTSVNSRREMQVSRKRARIVFQP